MSINFNDKVKTIPIELITDIQDDITDNTYFDEVNSAVVIRKTLCLQLIDKRINDYIEKQLSSTSDTESYADTRATCPFAENKLVDGEFGGQTLETFCSKDACEYQDEVYDKSNEEYRKVCRV